MATNWIVWDKVNKVFVAGPFLSSAAATSFASRKQTYQDGKITDKLDKSSQYTIETVTVP